MGPESSTAGTGQDLVHIRLGGATEAPPETSESQPLSIAFPLESRARPWNNQESIPIT
jgi:hypothetical protein